MIPIVIGIGIVSVVGYLIFFKSPRQSDCFNGKNQASLSEEDKDISSSSQPATSIERDVILLGQTEKIDQLEENPVEEDTIIQQDCKPKPDEKDQNPTENESKLNKDESEAKESVQLVDILPKSKVTFDLGNLEGPEDDLMSKPEISDTPAGVVSQVVTSRKCHSADKIPLLATLHEDSEMDKGLGRSSTVEAISYKDKKSTLIRQNTMYETADVVTFVSKMNVCFGIFKNPSDHMTHFYSRRIKGSGENGVPLELRNVAASIRVWGKQWDRIHNIKFSLKSSDAFLDKSKERNQLEYQFEDCQNKFGCRIILQDFKLLSTQDRNVFSDLLDKIQNCCISDDDTEYFRLKDDSGLLNNTYFDL